MRCWGSGQSLGRPKIVLEADDFVLPPERMAPLGLVISELITNALKYGKGAIEVIVKYAGDHALLTVRDEGDGFPDNYPKPTGTGLGMLVKAIPATAARRLRWIGQIVKAVSTSASNFRNQAIECVPIA